MTWEQLANCRSEGVDPDWFFPASSKAPEAKIAKALCDWCVVRGQCKERGRLERYGIWGGIDERQRKDGDDPS